MIRIFALLVFLGVVLPPVFAQPKVSELAGWRVEFGTVSKVKAGTRATNVKVSLPGYLADVVLTIPELVYDSHGTILSSLEGTLPVELPDMNGFHVRADSYSLGPRGLQITGVVFLPEALGGTAVAFPRGKLFLDANGEFVADKFMTSVSWGGDFNAESSWIRIEQSILTLGPGSIRWPDKERIPFGAALFNRDGSLIESSPAEGKLTLNVQGFLVTEARGFQWAGQDGWLQLQWAGDIHLPPPFQDAVCHFDRLVLSDGEVRSDGARKDAVLSSHGIEFVLPDLAFGPKGLFSNNPALRFPPSVGGELLLGRLNITASGMFLPDRGDVLSMELLGLPVVLDSIAFDAKGLVGKGGNVFLRMAGDLPMPTIVISSIAIDYDGTLRSSATQLSVMGVHLSDAFGTELQEPRIAFRQAAQGRPIELALSGTIETAGPPATLKIPVLSVPVDVSGKRLKLEEMQTGPVEWEAGGIRFHLKLRNLDLDGVATLQGWAETKTPPPGWPIPGPQGYLVKEFQASYWEPTIVQLQASDQAKPFQARFDGQWSLLVQ